MLAGRHRFALGLLVLVLLTGGCGSSFDAQTNQMYQPAVGTEHRLGDVYAMNVFVVAQDSKGTLVGALLNQAGATDSLVGVEAKSDEGSLQTSGPSSDLRLRRDQLVQLTQGGPLGISGKGLTPGLVIDVTMQFANAAPITLKVPVVTRSGPYKTIPIQ